MTNLQQRLAAFDNALRKPRFRATITMEVSEIHRADGNESGHLVVKPASELPDKLPDGFLYTSSIQLKHFTKEDSEAIAVGDKIAVTGELSYGRFGLRPNAFFFSPFAIPSEIITAL